MGGIRVGGRDTVLRCSMFSADHLRAYREAAGWAVQFEFMLRAITPALWAERRGSAKDLEAMYADIVEELKSHLTAENLADLAAVNLCDLRDDIVHSRMSKAFGKLGGRNNAAAVARVMHLDDGQDPIEMVRRMARGEGQPIPSTKTETGGVAMWLVQMAESGFFGQAARAFHKGCVILDGGLGARASATLSEPSRRPPP